MTLRFSDDRHPREGGEPVFVSAGALDWIPACAGKTGKHTEFVAQQRLRNSEELIVACWLGGMLSLRSRVSMWDGQEQPTC